MKIEFTKMHGLGNDFMVINQVTQNVELSPEMIRRWADRHTGIGFDQLLLVSPPSSPDVDFSYRIFNADGSEVEQCGNGARCFARFVYDKKLTSKQLIPVETLSGRIQLKLESSGLVTVNMGQPVFEPAQIPLQADHRQSLYKFDVDGDSIELACVSMGNPHGVLQVYSVEAAPVEKLGPKLEAHPLFPNKANIGFCEVVDRDHLLLRVYERGAGETLACGTGACAAAVVNIAAGRVNNNVSVTLPGGTLQIEWQGEGHPVMMTGPATTVYEGIITV
ncbi:MAG: diaminopimelate epimerase [Gammaproteobacteria bacterium]